MDCDDIQKLTSVFSEIFLESLDFAYQIQIINAKEPRIIPELTIEASNVCSILQKEILTFFENDEEETEIEKIYRTIGRFCLCAGMGAVAHWNLNYSSMKKKGIYNTLVEARGLYTMDEYVYDLVGLNMGSTLCEEFISKSFTLYDFVFKTTFDSVTKLLSDKQTKISQYVPLILLEVNKIMYKIGINCQVEKTFMHPNIQRNEEVDYRHIYELLKETVNPELQESFYAGYTGALLNKAVALFEEVKLKEDYILDVFEFAFDYPRTKKKEIKKYKMAYVHKKNPSGRFEPILRRTKLQKLLNIIPKNIQFDNTEYSDNLIVSGVLYTKECIKTLSVPYKYVTCNFNKKSAWEFFLFTTLIEHKINPILFNYEQLTRACPPFYKNGFDYAFNKEDETKLKALDYTPSIELTKPHAIIEVYQKKNDSIIKLKLILEYSNDRFMFCEFQENIIASLKQQPRIFLKRDVDYNALDRYLKKDHKD